MVFSLPQASGNVQCKSASSLLPKCAKPAMGILGKLKSQHTWRQQCWLCQGPPPCKHVSVLVSPIGARLGGLATYQDGEDHRPSDDPPDRRVGIDVPAPREGQPGMTRSGELG